MIRPGFLHLGTLSWIILFRNNPVGCVVASLTSTKEMPGASSSHNNQKCLQSLPNVPGGAKPSLVEKHWIRQTNTPYAAFKPRIRTKYHLEKGNANLELQYSFRDSFGSMASMVLSRGMKLQIPYQGVA